MRKILFIFIISFNLFAAGEDQRFQKPKLHRSGKTDIAFELLKKNLLSDTIHRKSLTLFSTIAEEKKQYHLSYRSLEMLILDRYKDFYKSESNLQLKKQTVSSFAKWKESAN